MQLVTAPKGAKHRDFIFKFTQGNLLKTYARNRTRLKFSYSIFDVNTSMHLIK